MAASFTHQTKNSDWETVAQGRTIARLCVLFKVYSVERCWKVLRDRLRWAHYLKRVEYRQKIRNRKQGTVIGKYSLVNNAIKNWNQLTAKVLDVYLCKSKFFRKIG